MSDNGNLKEIDELLLRFSHFPEIPRFEIFQYSRSSTLKSLIEKKKLWATEHLFLNDPTEFKHGMRIFQKSLLAFLATTTLPKASIDRIMFVFEDSIESPPIKFFISSFTKNGDILSQWRGYGDSGKGLSIGFDALTIPIDERNRTSFWCEVIYDDNIKISIVQNIMNHFSIAFNAVCGLTGSSQQIQLTNLVVAYIQVATLHSLKFKDWAWREEEEWRFIAMSFPQLPMNVLVRDRDSELIEYIEVPLFENFLLSIYVGPRSNFKVQSRAISTLTSSKVIIRKSTIPWL